MIQILKIFGFCDDSLALAEKEGFAAFDPSRTYQAGDRVYFNNRGKALILAFIGKKGCKNGQILWPIRIAMSGKQTTPCGASEMMEVLGKEESLKRLRAAIETLEKKEG